MFRLCPDPLPSAPALLHLARFRFRAFRFPLSPRELFHVEHI